MDDEVVASTKSISIEEVVHVILEELQSLRKEVTEEMKKISEKLECVLELSISNASKAKSLKSCSMNKSDELFPRSKQHSISTSNVSSTINIRKGTKRLIASDDSCGQNEVIDITDFFDDLEVPQFSSSASSASTPNSLLSINCAPKEVCVSKFMSPKIIPSHTTSHTTSGVNEAPTSSQTLDSSIAEENLMQSSFSDCSTDSEPSISKIVNAADDTSSGLNDIDNNSILSDAHSMVSSDDNSQVNSTTSKSLLAASLAASSSNTKQNSSEADGSSLLMDASACQVAILTDPKSGDKIYECPFCNKQSKQLRDMKRHLLVHTGIRRHKCIFCNKAFKRASHMKCHMRTHTGEKPFPCDKCPKAFCGSGALFRHKQTHEKDPSLQNQADIELYSLDSKPKPYVCEFCDKRFRHKAHRDSHVRTHTGEKEFDCLVCYKMFARKEHLERHMRSHTGEKPYKCPMCPKHFSDSSSVRKHQKIH